ncbi:MAG: hypothetical protein H7Y16_05965 [Candidatus Parcubacteria bacterium]|nr:hypothetical protein [Burkholderiales bacterium]
MGKREDYVDTLKAQIDQWSADIGKWEAKADQAHADARADFEKRLEALRAHREQAMYQLTLLNSAAGEAWRDLARGADEAWERMRGAMEDASSHFRTK